ncbi:MAG TPA: glycosyltransferase [Vicinamibacterales bacterium]|nr:glycosyltransferase [Vicinamibacterales bacterium]
MRMPLRIAYVSDRPFPSFWTDTQQVMKNAEALALAGAEVRLAIPRAYRSIVRPAARRHRALREFYGVSASLDLQDILTIPCTPARLEKWPHALVAQRRAALAGCDLLYSRNLFPAWLAARRRSRVVYETHRRFDAASGLKARAFLDLAGRRELVGVVTNSEYVRESLLRAGVGADRVLSSKLGHDPRDFAARLTKVEACQALALDPRRPLAVYAGHVDATKGIDALLAIAGLLPDVGFLLVGGSRIASAALAVRARRMGLSNVSTRPRVPPRAVVPYLYASDILINPPSSTLLAFPHTITPIKLYNYLAAGRPIVAGRTPDVAELLTHDVDALLCRPDDPHAAADAIARVLRTPELAARLAARALETSARYTWEERGRRILRFIQARLDEGRS